MPFRYHTTHSPQTCKTKFIHRELIQRSKACLVTILRLALVTMVGLQWVAKCSYLVAAGLHNIIADSRLVMLGMFDVTVVTALL